MQLHLKTSVYIPTPAAQVLLLQVNVVQSWV